MKFKLFSENRADVSCMLLYFSEYTISSAPMGSCWLPSYSHFKTSKICL